MDIEHNVFNLQFRVDALELLLISRGETNRENLEIFRKEAQKNYSKAQDEFRQKQWAKIKLGSLIEYELTPMKTLTIEVLTISPTPFECLAGKIIEKSGKSGYRIGEIFIIHSPSKIILAGGYGMRENISR